MNPLKPLQEIGAVIIDRVLNGQPVETEIDIEELYSLQSELYVRKLAFQSAVNLIANAVSKCEFKTFFENKEIQKEEYYLFNYEPNQNQNASEFIHKMINRLYKKNEVLIIEQGGKIYVADNFTKTKYALYDYQFTNVVVDEMSFSRTFYMSDVMYLKLQDENIKHLIDGMYEAYGKLISYAQDSYKKSRGRRGILNIDAQATNDDVFKNTLKDLMEVKFKTYFEANNAVLPLFKGWDYQEQGSKTYSNEGTRDIKAMVDDIYDLTARAFSMPAIVLKGDVANIQDAVDSLLTFCIDPLCDSIQKEATRKRCGKNGFKKGNYLVVDTSRIKHIDLFSISSGSEKLIGSGLSSINEVRKAIGWQPIPEDWADKHFMTKNFTDITELLKQLLGNGGDDGG